MKKVIISLMMVTLMLVAYAADWTPYIDRMQFQKSPSGYTYVVSQSEIDFNRCYAYYNYYESKWEEQRINSSSNPCVKRKSDNTSCGSATLTHTDTTFPYKDYQAVFGNYLDEYEAYFEITFVDPPEPEDNKTAPNQIYKDYVIVDREGESTM